MLGNIEELGRTATGTASLLTLYYKEQIQSIDISAGLKPKGIFDREAEKIKCSLFDVRPESYEELPVVEVAEYINGWLIEKLRGFKGKLDPERPLPKQLWRFIAQLNCVDQEKDGKTLEFPPKTGQRNIPLKIKNDNGEETPKSVQLCHLIGCVSIVTYEKKIYRYDVSKGSSDENLEDLEPFGYVYITPFLDDEESVQTYIEESQRDSEPQDSPDDLLDKLKEIEYTLNISNVNTMKLANY